MSAEKSEKYGLLLVVEKMNSLKRNAKISIISFSLFQVFTDATVNCHNLGQFDRRWAAEKAEKGVPIRRDWVGQLLQHYPPVC